MRRELQVARFDLSSGSTDPTFFDLSAAVPGATFSALAVRVVNATDTATYLVVGGQLQCCGPQYPALLVYGSVATGSTSFTVMGSTVVQSAGSGVTALSQTSALQSGSVLASTDQGVYKCAPGDVKGTCKSSVAS